VGAVVGAGAVSDPADGVTGSDVQPASSAAAMTGSDNFQMFMTRIRRHFGGYRSQVSY